MSIRRISLCQNELHTYESMPRSIGWGTAIYGSNPNDDTISIGLLGGEEENLIYKLREEAVQSEICNHLNVVLTPDNSFISPELTSFIAFKKDKMRFVNVYVDPEKFNNADDSEKRKTILDAIESSLQLVVNEEYKGTVKKICDEVYSCGDELECVFKTKKTSKYIIRILYKAKASGYTAVLHVKNIKNGMESRKLIFEDKHYAYFRISLHKIVVKGGKCIIYSDSTAAPDDEPIIIDIDI